MKNHITNLTGISAPDQTEWIRENINLLEIGSQNLPKIFSATTSTAAGAALVFICTFFFLYYSTKFKKFILKLTQKRADARMEKITDKISKSIPSYLIGVLIVMGILSVINTFGFWIVGVKNPLFFGIIVSVLNVIPYVGTAIGFGFVVIFTLLTQSIGTAIAVIALFIIIQFIDNNILTPKIAAGQINVNPLAAILGILVGGIVWGIVGMIIAIPILGIIKIFCDNTDGLEAFGYLIGTEGKEEQELDVPFSKKS